jgi:cholesterol transport system auxiliary component
MSDDTVLAVDRRFLFLGGGALFVLAGCGGILPKPAANQIYLLKPMPVPPAAGPKVDWALVVRRPDAIDSLDTNRIAIMRSADTLDYYANAQWPDRLPELVANELVQGFRESGRITQVSRMHEGLHADYVLQTQLHDFEARYDTPDGAPTIVIRIGAQLVARKTRSAVGSLIAAQSAPAAANSIDAAVQAFDRAMGAAVRQIVDWTLQTAPPL